MAQHDSSDRITVCFVPGRTVSVEPGTSLVEAAQMLGISLNMPCGGEGTCGKCRVLVRSLNENENEPNPDAIDHPPQNSGFSETLACRAVVHQPLEVLLPETAILDDALQVLTDHDHQATHLPTPANSAKCAEASLQAPDECNWGVAIDIGTTTLAASLVDLSDGQVLAVASRLNPQTRHGDDVISRIQYVIENQTSDDTSNVGLQRLHRSIIDATRQMLDELAASATVSSPSSSQKQPDADDNPTELLRRISRVTISGNTTMQHLFAGLDVAGLGQLPFTPATCESITLTASQLGLQHLADGAMVHILPVIGGYVGGDTISGILCTKEAEPPHLLIDIGTNGEIVLTTADRRFATATAAGPALEGARITFGMRASRGAIQRVEIKGGECRIETIHETRPVGICGSGLIDAVAELLSTGIITPQGRMLSADSPQLDSLKLDKSLRRRLVTHDGKPAFELADASESGNVMAGIGRPILLTQHDVRQLQLASGAIRAGIMTLLKRAGLTVGDLNRVFLAGGFGNYIRRGSAQRIGLLPPELPLDRVEFRGNTSIGGARLALLSKEVRDQMDQLARETEHVDLSTDPDFQWTFAESMIFPE